VKGLCLGTGLALAASAVGFSLAPVSGLASGPELDARAARNAARQAVLSHSSYRVIHHPSRLRIRGCKRLSRRTMRCTLEVTVGYRCQLAGPPPPEAYCTAVTGYRRWVVRVRAGHRPAARIVSVSSG
jgi:hypothetical protein